MAVQDPTTTYEYTPAAKKSKVTGEKEKDKSVLPVEEVDFSDDNGEALLILLRIAHLRFHDTPTTLAYQTLLQVAVLCDQYQCINLVRPWLPQWLADENNHPGSLVKRIGCSLHGFLVEKRCMKRWRKIWSLAYTGQRHCLQKI